MSEQKQILGLTTKQAIWTGIGLLVALGGGTALWYFVLREDAPKGRKTSKNKGRTADSRRSKRTGDAASNGTAAMEIVDPDDANALDAQFYGQASKWAKHFLKKSIKKLSLGKAYAKAKAIEAAWGTFNDNEAAVYKLFRAMKTKADVSRVAAVYEKTFEETLEAALIRKLDTDELAKVKSIISNKENYQTT